MGVIADTHGLVRPEALMALQGSELIIHAGDIGSRKVLDELRRLAPVVAVRGNIDKGPWAEALPQTETVEIAGAAIYVLHDLNELEFAPAAARFGAIISGHSHQPSLRRSQGILLLNPGSAGPRRFKLPVSVALLFIREGRIEARLLSLEIPGGGG